MKLLPKSGICSNRAEQPLFWPKTCTMMTRSYGRKVVSRVVG